MVEAWKRMREAWKRSRRGRGAKTFVPSRTVLPRQPFSPQGWGHSRVPSYNIYKIQKNKEKRGLGEQDFYRFSPARNFSWLTPVCSPMLPSPDMVSSLPNPKHHSWHNQDAPIELMHRGAISAEERDSPLHPAPFLAPEPGSSRGVPSYT